MEYLIRKVEEKDLATLVELCQKHSDYENAIYNPNGKQELLKNAIFSDRQKLFCFVVESNNNLVGYASYTFDFSTWDANTFLYLDCLYLDPNFRGLGIGEIIIEKLKEIATQNGCINIQWQTPVFNERAIKFYNRIGGTGKDKVRFFIDLQRAN
jgi:ribosomal protein S18 acetylase RimI-like enzyme